MTLKAEETGRRRLVDSAVAHASDRLGLLLPLQVELQVVASQEKKLKEHADLLSVVNK